MKIVIFTSNALRHKYVANTLIADAQEALVISEQRPSDAPTKPESDMTLTEQHFAERYRFELDCFKGNETFTAPTLEIEYKSVNTPKIYEKVKAFAPDMGFVFGASIITDPLLSLIPSGKFVNMHLGLSPYYRGSGTNFWPFINEELEYIGATLLHIDSGIDTGDIIAHARPTIEKGDTVHSIGNKTIIAGTQVLRACLKRVADGKELHRVKQWPVEHERYYKTKEFTDDSVRAYRKKLHEGIVERYLQKPPHVITCVGLED